MAIATAAATLIALTGVYWLASWVGVPLLVQRGLLDWQAQLGSTQVTLERASFNPWTLALTARRLSVHDMERPLIEADELRVDVSLSSLWRRAIIADEIDLKGVSIYLRRDANGHLDIERLLPHHHGPRTDTRASSGVRWQINRFALSALRVQLTAPSAGLSEPLEVTLPRLEIDHLGTLEGSRNDFTVNLHGRSGGEPVWDLLWRGDLDFAPFASTGHLRLTHISLPWLDQASGYRWPAHIHSGRAEIDAEYQLGDVQGQQRLIVRNANIDVRQLDVRGADHVAPALALRELRIQVDNLDTSQHMVLGKALLLDNPELTLHRLPNGELDLVSLAQRWPNRTDPASPSSPAWSIRWPVAEVRSAAVLFEDLSPSHLGQWRLPAINLRVEDFDNQADSALRITARGAGLVAIPSPPGTSKPTGQWDLRGNIRVGDAAVRAAWTLSDLDLRPFGALPSVKAMADIRSGRLSMEGRIAGTLHHLDQALISTTLHLREPDLTALPFGALSAEAVQIGPLQVTGRQWQLERLHAAQLNWTGASVAAAQMRGRQQDLTLTGLKWDGRKQQLALRNLAAAAGTVTLQKAEHTVRLRWDGLQLRNAAADLARERFRLESVTGGGLGWQGRQPWLQLQTWQLQDLRADLLQRQLELQGVAIHHGRLRLSLRRNGTLAPLVELVSVLPALDVSQASGMRSGGPPASQPWDIHLHGLQLGLDALRLGKPDTPLLPLTATRIKARLGEWRSTATEPVEAHVRATLEGGLVQWDGTVSPTGSGTDGRLEVQNINLAWLQPFLHRNSYAAIDRGTASLSGSLLTAGPEAHYRGALSTGALRIVDARNHQPLLSWNSADIAQVQLDWPGRLQVSRIVLDGLLTSVTIHPDHHLNWESLVRPSRVATPGTHSEAGSTPVRNSTMPPWTLQLEQLSLTDSGLDFTDQTLATPFTAILHGLEGTLGPFDTQTPKDWSQLRLAGRVNNYGHVEMTGRLMPLSQPLRGRVDLHFSSIQLPTLNPYAAEIAGYRIERGMLDLELRYAFEQGVIEGDNRARIEQLVLGPQVNPRDAPDLPLRAIIDILRNDEGVIDLDVPVRGNLDDPDIVMRDVAFKAIQGALRKTLESPFRLVADLFGGDEETLRHIDFAAGAADLVQHDLHKLNGIAQVLSKHHRLLMYIQPAYNAAADVKGKPQTAAAAPALRALALRRAQAIKAVLVAADVPPDRIYIDEPTALTSLGKDGTVPTTLDLKAP